jgi:hypothetical protein
VLLLLTHRKLPQSKAIAIDNDLRGTLRNFGLKVGMVGDGEVRGTDQGVGREPTRFGSADFPCRASSHLLQCMSPLLALSGH